MANYQNAFEEYIDLAKNALKLGNFVLAEERIKNAMYENPHSPCVHNLYGILEELLKEDNLAHKHYQVANVLDPTYKPAYRNLERISSFEGRPTNKPIDFGDEPEKEDDDLYVVEYDKNHVGHLQKKEGK